MESEINIAITVDDLPIHGDIVNPYSYLALMSNVTRIFKKYDLPPIVGFVNAKNLKYLKNDISLLKDWVSSKNVLANHTFSHHDLSLVTSKEFIEDIQINEGVLSKFSNYKKYFRYPFLSESNSELKRNTVKNYLNLEKYVITPVTIDFYDFLWNTAVCKCIAYKKNQDLNLLEKKYIDTAIETIKKASEISISILGRNISHIMLLHFCTATSLFLENLIISLKKFKVKFITLNQALKDPIYSNDYYKPEWNGFNFLQMLALSNKMDIENYPDVPKRDIQRYSYNIPSSINIV